MAERAQAKQDGQTTFLVFLYGTLEYDGRVQRLQSVLESLGRTELVDLARGGMPAAAPGRRRLVPPAGAGVLRRHLCFWRFALAAALRLRPRFIVAEDFYTAFPGRLAAGLTGAKLVYDAHELILPERGERRNWRCRIWYLLEKPAVRRAALVLAANAERARAMQRHYRLPQAPLVMQNFSPPRETPPDRGALFQKFPPLCRRAPAERLLLYQGNIALERGLERFLCALAVLPSGYRLIIAGGGPDRERLRTAGRALEEAGRLDFLGPVENRLLPALAAAADVGIVAYPFRGQNNIYCASNKIFEYLQAGIPVVATAQPPLRRLVAEYGLGALVGRDDPPAVIAEKLREVAENRARYLAGRSRFLQEHRWRDEASRVRAALKILIETSGGPS